MADPIPRLSKNPLGKRARRELMSEQPSVYQNFILGATQARHQATIDTTLPFVADIWLDAEDSTIKIIAAPKHEKKLVLHNGTLLVRSYQALNKPVQIQNEPHRHPSPLKYTNRLNPRPDHL